LSRFVAGRAGAAGLGGGPAAAVSALPAVRKRNDGITYDEVFRQLSRSRFVPALRVVPPYYAHAAYVEALAESAREAMTPLPRRPGKILISFHGIPQRFVDSGDPYASHCEATTRLLAARAGWRMARTSFPINRAPAASRGYARTRTRPWSHWREPVFET